MTLERPQIGDEYAIAVVTAAWYVPRSLRERVGDLGTPEVRGTWGWRLSTR